MSERQARRDRNATVARSERDIDALFRPLSRAVGASVRRHTMQQNATPAITLVIYARIMRDVDEALIGVRGRYPGDRSAPLYRLVVRRCIEARALAFRRAVEDVRQRLRGEPELLAAIERDAG